MNIESFGYALLAALVGMAIVFLFLVVLSVIMVVLRRLLDGAPGATALPTADRNAARTDGATRPADGDPPQWVVAGVMAYLASEERNRAPHAGVWTTRGRS